MIHWLHLKELTVHVGTWQNLHVLRGLTLVELTLNVLRLLHAIVLEHTTICVNGVLHLAWKHMSSKLLTRTSLESSGLSLVLLMASHRIHVHSNWLGSQLVAAMCKCASLLVRTLTPTFDELALDGLVIGLVSSKWPLALLELVLYICTWNRWRHWHKCLSWETCWLLLAHWLSALETASLGVEASTIEIVELL